MATYTGTINLYKWNTSDSSDLNSKFDIDLSLNDNWDKIDAAIAQDRTNIANLQTNKANASDVYTTSAVDGLLNNKVDKVAGKGLSTNDYDNTEKAQVEKNRTNILLRSLITETGNKIALEINNTTFVLTAKLYDKNNNLIHTSNGIDLPLETMVVNASYNNTTKKIVLTLQNGTTVDFSVADLVSGLVSETTFNTALANKVDKVAGKGLSTNDYTNEDKEQVEANKTDIEDLKETSEDLSIRVVALERKTGKVYGIKRKITDNTATTWERIEDAVGKVANAKKATSSAVQNDFNDIYPWSGIKTCNVDSNGNITNYIDEPGFAFDGSNGEVMTRIPTLWFKREIVTDENEDDWEYIYIADYAKEGFTRVDEFLIARYNLSVDSSNKAHSISGAMTRYNTNIATFRTYARNLSTDYCLMDWRVFILQMLYLVEYADYNSQNILGQGIVAYSSAKAIKAESAVNRIIVTTAGTGLYVGKTICIGTTAAWNAGVASNRQITSIEDYDDGEVSGKAIYFDGEAVNIAVNNMIWGSAQITGDCDSLGMESGCLINDGYHSMIYRGVENIFGNVWQHVDGINIKDYQAYICYDPSEYVSDKFTSPYEAIGYLNSQTSDSYIKELGYDENNPAIALPVTVAGSSSTCVTDNYWCSAGNRIAYLGGYFGSNWAKDGFFAWNCSDASGISSWSYGARLLKYQ